MATKEKINSRRVSMLYYLTQVHVGSLTNSTLLFFSSDMDVSIPTEES